MPCFARSVGSVVVFSLAVAAQQSVPLPHGTGSVAVPQGWTTLGATELAADARASDPAAEPARSMLQQMVAELRERERTAEHVLLHAPGAAPGQLRSVNCYSAAVRATAEELLRAETVDTMQRAWVEAIGRDGVVVTFAGHGDPGLFATGSVRLGFSVRAGELESAQRLHVVPAGGRLQYFETSHAVADGEADAAIDAVLRSFDGAAAPGWSPAGAVLRGAIYGSIGGLAVWLARRARRRRDAAPAATARR